MKLRQFSLIQILFLLLALSSNLLGFIADPAERQELLPHLLFANSAVLVLLTLLTRQQLLNPLHRLAGLARQANRKADGSLRVDCGLDLCETVLIGAVLQDLQPQAAPQAATSDTPPSPNTAIDTGDLPPLAGLDLAAGLNQHAQDLPRYTAALSSFSRTFAGIPSQLTGLINQGDWDTALPLVDSLNRSATIIGAVRVQEQAASLLSACQRRDEIDARVALPPLASALDPILQGLDRHFAAEE